MAAFATVALEKAGNYEGKPYKKGTVLRVPSETARRWLTLETAKPYDGGKKPENVESKSTELQK